MNTRKPLAKIMAWMLTLVMLVSIMPTTAFVQAPNTSRAVSALSANAGDIVLAALGNPSDDYYISKSR